MKADHDRRLQATLDCLGSLRFCGVVADRSGRLLCWNDAARGLIAEGRRGGPGDSLDDLLPLGEGATTWQDLSREVDRVGTWQGEGRRQGAPVDLRPLAIRAARLDRGMYMAILHDAETPGPDKTLRDAVYEIARAAADTGDIDHLFPRLHEIVRTLMPARSFYFTLYDEQAGTVAFPYFVSEKYGTPAVTPRPLAHGLTEYLIRIGRPLLLDARGMHELEATGEIDTVVFPCESWLGVPLRAGDPIVGTMVALSFSSLQKYTAREQAIFEYIARLVAMAIQRKTADEKRARLEESLRQAEKLESIGRLAGGVAHDLNNLLVPILGYADLIDREPSPGSIRKMAQQIRSAAEHSRDLIQQLLAFARKQVLEPAVLDLRTAVSGMESLLRRTIREDVRIVISLPATPVPVRADRGRLGQVLMNLSVNAQDAMASGGTLTIAVTEEPIPATEGARHAVLTVRDTGVGMDEATRRSVFEPFFTTKERGRGTGLGLATVYGIVKQHGGDIEVTSTPGAGSVFRVFLPLSTDPAEPSAARTAVEPERGGTETILLAEDDESVRSLTRLLLEQAGYRVICCRDGAETLAGAREHPGAIDLLLTDVVMPDMTGKQLADRIVAARPGIEVLFTSGYTDDIIAEHGVLDAATRFISKPFDGRGLRSKVREVLDGRRNPPRPPRTPGP